MNCIHKISKKCFYTLNMSSKKYKIDPKNPWKDPRGCMALPGGCDKPLCAEFPKHNKCNPVKIKEKYRPQIDEANVILAQENAKLQAEQQCSSIQSQIASTKAALADCNTKLSACEQSTHGGAGQKAYKCRPRKGKNQRGGVQDNSSIPPETPGQLTKRLVAELNAVNAKIAEAKAKLAAGATCRVNLNALNTELTAIKTALADCDAKKKTACEAPKPIDNGTFNLNTRADLSHIRGAGRKVYGTYQRGPKKGKLKKGFKFVNGVATKVM